MAPALVCTTAFQDEQLVAILDNQQTLYNWLVTGVSSTTPNYIRLFESYTLGSLHGVINLMLYEDPYGKQPWAIPLFTVIAALTDKAIADANSYAYHVQSLNTVAVLLSEEVQLNVADLQGQITANAKALGNDINVARAEAENYAGAVANRVQGNLNVQAAALGGYINQARAEAEAYTSAVGTALGNDINKARSQAEDFAGTAISKVQAQVDQLATTVNQVVGTDVSSLTQQIAAVANTAEQQVKNAVVTAEQYATSLQPGAVAAAVAAAVAQLQPQINAIKTDTAECLDPLCDTVTPNAKQLGNLGKLLGLFTDAALSGLLLAFLVECATDPAQAADDVVGDLGGLVGDTASGFRSLIGV